MNTYQIIVSDHRGLRYEVVAENEQQAKALFYDGQAECVDECTIEYFIVQIDKLEDVS